MSPTLTVLLLLWSTVHGETWLPKDYNSKVPPRKPMEIHVDINVKLIRKIHDLDQYWSSEVALSIKWMDKRLVRPNTKSRKDDYPFASVATTDCLFLVSFSIMGGDALDMVWKPDVYIYDSRDISLVKFYDVASSLDVNTTSGELRWWSQYRLKVDCSMDFVRFVGRKVTAYLIFFFSGFLWIPSTVHS